jgi:hypothetical protein
VNAGYAKFETFPIWNMPLRHPVNVAYEAATADLRDFNMIDPFHLEAHGERAVNYNRDVEAFPLLKRILEKITGITTFYESPTDMGVNRAGMAIVDEKAAAEAAKQEIIRRFFRYSCEHAMGLADEETIRRVRMLMEELHLAPEQRAVVHQPQPVGVSSRPERQLDHQPYGPHGDGAAPQAPRLRGPHHPPALTGRRAGAAPHRGQPHLRPPLCHAEALRVVVLARRLMGDSGPVVLVSLGAVKDRRHDGAVGGPIGLRLNLSIPRRGTSDLPLFT